MIADKQQASVIFFRHFADYFNLHSQQLRNTTKPPLLGGFQQSGTVIPEGAGHHQQDKTQQEMVEQAQRPQCLDHQAASWVFRKCLA